MYWQICELRDARQYGGYGGKVAIRVLYNWDNRFSNFNKNLAKAWIKELINRHPKVFNKHHNYILQVNLRRWITIYNIVKGYIVTTWEEYDDENFEEEVY